MPTFPDRLYFVKHGENFQYGHSRGVIGYRYVRDARLTAKFIKTRVTRSFHTVIVPNRFMIVDLGKREDKRAMASIKVEKYSLNRYKDDILDKRFTIHVADHLLHSDNALRIYCEFMLHLDEDLNNYDQIIGQNREMMEKMYSNIQN